MSTPPAALGFKQVLSLAPVRRLWLAQLISVFGDFLAMFAVFSVATFRFRASATEISLILAAYMLPLAVIGPVAGVLVDRWDKRRAMILSDLLRAGLAMLLVFAQTLPQIYAIFFALSVVSSFFMPAQSVVLRTLVPQSGLMAANALMAQAMQVTMIVSPAIAGTLVAWTGPEICFYADVASFLASALLVSRIAVAHTPEASGLKFGSILSELGTGLKFIFTHSAVSFVMIAMTCGMFAIRCFGALFSVYVRDILHAGSASFGVLNSLTGVGMICGTQAVHHLGARQSKNSLVVTGLLVAGGFILLLAAVGTVPAAAAGMFGMGLGVACIFIPSQTILQEATPMALLGRVSSSMWSSLAFIQVVALTLSGSAAERIGIRNLYFSSAALLVFIALAGARVLVLRGRAQANVTAASV